MSTARRGAILGSFSCSRGKGATLEGLHQGHGFGAGPGTYGRVGGNLQKMLTVLREKAVQKRRKW